MGPQCGHIKLLYHFWEKLKLNHPRWYENRRISFQKCEYLPLSHHLCGIKFHIYSFAPNYTWIYQDVTEIIFSKLWGNICDKSDNCYHHMLSIYYYFIKVIIICSSDVISVVCSHSGFLLIASWRGNNTQYPEGDNYYKYYQLLPPLVHPSTRLV